MDYLIDNYTDIERCKVLFLNSTLIQKENKWYLSADLGYISVGLNNLVYDLFDAEGVKIMRVELPKLAKKLPQDVVTTLKQDLIKIIEIYEQ